MDFFLPASDGVGTEICLRFADLSSAAQVNVGIKRERGSLSIQRVATVIAERYVVRHDVGDESGYRNTKGWRSEIELSLLKGGLTILVVT